MIKRIILTLTFLALLSLPAWAQVDYLEYKEKYSISCTIPDSAVIMSNQQLMDSLQSLEITGGEKVFLYDLGWLYYMKYMKWKNREDLEKAASTFERGWNEHQDLGALWNLGGIYRRLENCEKSLNLTELFIEQAADSVDVDYQQVYYRYKHCRKIESKKTHTKTE